MIACKSTDSVPCRDCTHAVHHLTAVRLAQRPHRRVQERAGHKQVRNEGLRQTEKNETNEGDSGPEEIRLPLAHKSCSYSLIQHTSHRTDGKGGRDEIFVDMVERITCTFNTTGNMSQSQVGSCVMVENKK